MTEPGIYVTVISHRHGENLYANRTLDGVRQVLYDYVVEWWDQEVADKPSEPGGTDKIGPIDGYEHEAAISLYFEVVENEWFVAQPVNIGP